MGRPKQDRPVNIETLNAQLKAANEARKDLGLPLLSARVRKCLQCGCQFPSIEARTCNPCIKKRDSE